MSIANGMVFGAFLLGAVASCTPGRIPSEPKPFPSSMRAVVLNRPFGDEMRWMEVEVLATEPEFSSFAAHEAVTLRMERLSGIDDLAPGDVIEASFASQMMLFSNPVQVFPKRVELVERGGVSLREPSRR